MKKKELEVNLASLDFSGLATAGILPAAAPPLTEWQRARLGKITGSCFHLIKKTAKGVWGETALSYLYDLLGEHLSGESSQTFTGNAATRWGNDNEAQAIAEYKKRTRRKVRDGKFVQHKNFQLIGCTPDGFIGNGILEVKCPFSFKNHIRTLETKKVPDEYMPQVLGNMWVTGTTFCDFVSFDPRLPKPQRLVILRVKAADYEAEINELASMVGEFADLLSQKIKALRK